jgi:hypothetical protein
MTGMNLRHLRRICAARVEALDLPFPFDVHKLCKSVERARGRMIHLVPRTLPAGSPSGLCVSTNVGDYIFYESQTSALHQEHIILHEVGHLLCEHRAASVSWEEISKPWGGLFLRTRGVAPTTARFSSSVVAAI